MMGINPNYMFQSTFSANRDRTARKELDKDAFLQILTTQLKYQDPTNPIDDREMITQLSQLSSTEQIMNMSKAFQGMIESQMNFHRIQTASLVGKMVVVEDNKLSLSEGKANNIIYSLETNSPVIVEIYNKNGQMIKQHELGAKEAGVHGYTWDGRDGAGISVPDGEYEYKIFNIVGGEKKQINGLEGGKVEAVQFSGNDFFVIVNGKKYSIDTIAEISEPLPEDDN